MRRWLLSLLVVLCFAGISRAQLFCEQPTVPLGDVPSGANVTHRFTLSNRGTTELVLGEVRTDCGCTVAKLDKRRLQPGEETSLGLLVNTLTQAAGSQSWPVRLQFHCGEQSGELLLALTATVVPTVTVEPPGIGISTESATRQEITLRDRRREPLAVRAVATTSPKLVAVQSGPEHDTEGNTVYTIQLDVAADFPEGRHNETLFLYTNDADFRELKIPVTINKKQRLMVQATPDTVTVALAKDQPLPSSLVRLRGSAEEAVQIERVEADHPAIHCLWAAGPNNMATVKIAFDRGKIEGDTIQSAIHVYVTRPATQVLTIPVSCTLR
jgi:hypothetical protein